MASIVPLAREYAYVLLRKKMSIRQNFLTSSTTICRYGDTKYVFPIGDLVAIAKIPIAAGSRFCRRLIYFLNCVKIARSSLFIPSSKGTKTFYACQSFVVCSAR
jgi:hypothetical protein